MFFGCLGKSLVGLVVLVLIIVAAIVVVMAISDNGSASPTPTATVALTATPGASSASPAPPTSTATASQGGGLNLGGLLGGATQTPAPGQTPGATPTPAPVAFVLNVQQTQPPDTSVLFNVKVTVHLAADLQDTGDSAAHNTKVNVRAKVGDSYVSINGQDTYTIDVGTVPAHGTVSKDVSFQMTMGYSQGNEAQNNGIVFEITVVSDEATQQMPSMRCTSSGCVNV